MVIAHARVRATPASAARFRLNAEPTETAKAGYVCARAHGTADRSASWIAESMDQACARLQVKARACVKAPDSEVLVAMSTAESMAESERETDASARVKDTLANTARLTSAMVSAVALTGHARREHVSVRARGTEVTNAILTAASTDPSNRMVVARARVRATPVSAAKFRLSAEPTEAAKAGSVYA